MTYREDSEQAAALARRALDHMERLRITPHPDNFEVWYAFVAGIDAELTRTLTELLDDQAAFDPDSYQAIKRSYLGSETTELLHSASESVDTMIASALSSLDAASSNARDYGSKLADFTGSLTIDIEQDSVRKLIAGLIAETRAVMSRNTELESELTDASNRIERLRDNLEDARRASETDGLTGLPNRRAFDLGLEAEIQRARQEDTPLTLLVADIDHFKHFNDTFGHRVGDEVLKLFSRIMKSLLKGRDKPARYGGEEFCALLPATDLEGALSVAEQVRKTISVKALKSARTGQSYGQITVSIGVAELAADDDSATLLDRGDAAMYLAKNSGRNRTCSEADLPTESAAKAAS